MKEAIDKARVLHEALGYIQAFRGKIFTVKLGGSFMDDPEKAKSALADIVFLQVAGIKPVIVHGGGKAINRALADTGIEPKFIAGQRYTDPVSLRAAERVLSGEISPQIVATLNELGGQATALTSLDTCVLKAEKKILMQDGQPTDLGLVGEPNGVNIEVVSAFTQAGIIPVISPIARDTNGHSLNCNADSAAGIVAAATQSEKLVLVSDTHGVRADPNDPSSLLLGTLTWGQIEGMKADGVIDKGMLPKVDACYTALKASVKKTHIIDGNIPHALLLEIFSPEGSGTQITLN